MSSSFNGCRRCWKHRFRVRIVIQLLSNCIHGQRCLDVLYGIMDGMGSIFLPKWHLIWNFMAEMAFVLMLLNQGRINSQFSLRFMPEFTSNSTFVWVPSQITIHRRIQGQWGVKSIQVWNASVWVLNQTLIHRWICVQLDAKSSLQMLCKWSHKIVKIGSYHLVSRLVP